VPKSSKPRKPRKARRDLIDPVHAAVMRATKLSRSEKSLLMDPVLEGFDKLRAGEWTNADFKHMADCLNVAEALTLPGFNLLPDHKHKLDAAHDALVAMAARRNRVGRWVAKGEELRTIELAIEIHDIQLDFASVGELARATKYVDDKLKGARSGSPAKGHIHTVLVEDRERVAA
jgi:hypothetical protein